MSFGEAIKTCFSKYVDFNGRARRSEYWYWFLFNMILSIIAGMLGTAIHTNVLTAVVSLALLLPTLFVTVRRMHDIGKSGWWVLIELIPVVGFIILLVWECKDSQPGDNAYGPNPKGL